MENITYDVLGPLFFMGILAIGIMVFVVSCVIRGKLPSLHVNENKSPQRYAETLTGRRCWPERMVNDDKYWDEKGRIKPEFDWTN